MTLEDEVRIGGKAAEVLNNDAFKAALGSIEEALLLGIRQSAFKDADLREKLCHRYALLYDLRAQLQTQIDTGQMAAMEIERLTTAQKVKNFFGM